MRVRHVRQAQHVRAVADWRRARVGALRRVKESRHGVRAAWRGGEDGPIVSALNELEQGDKIRVVEEIVISPPPVDGVAVYLIGVDATGAQESRDAVGARYT